MGWPVAVRAMLVARSGRSRARRARILTSLAVATALIAAWTPGAVAAECVPTTSFLGDYPHNEELPWSDDMQGVAHDDDHWFFTDTFSLLSLPRDFALDQDPDFQNSPNGEIRVRLSDVADTAGYNHFGDIDQHAGFIFAPLEGKDKSAIAVYDASDLSLIDVKDMTDIQGPKNGWIAVSPSTGNSFPWIGYLYTSPEHVSSDPRTFLFRYVINFRNLVLFGDLEQSLSFEGDRIELTDFAGRMAASGS